MLHLHVRCPLLRSQIRTDPPEPPTSTAYDNTDDKIQDVSYVVRQVPPPSILRHVMHVYWFSTANIS